MRFRKSRDRKRRGSVPRPVEAGHVFVMTASIGIEEGFPILPDIISFRQL